MELNLDALPLQQSLPYVRTWICHPKVFLGLFQLVVFPELVVRQRAYKNYR